MFGSQSFNVWLFDLSYKFFLTLVDVSVWLLSPLEILGVTIPITPISIFFGGGLLIYLTRIVVKFFTT